MPSIVLIIMIGLLIAVAVVYPQSMAIVMIVVPVTIPSLLIFHEVQRFIFTRRLKAQYGERWHSKSVWKVNYETRTRIKDPKHLYLSMNGVMIVSSSEVILHARSFLGHQYEFTFCPENHVIEWNPKLASFERDLQSWFAIGSPDHREHFFSVPSWSLFFASNRRTRALFDALRLRFRSACCVRCGYNLTGNTTRSCPECGLEFLALPSVDESVDVIRHPSDEKST